MTMENAEGGSEEGPSNAAHSAQSEQEGDRRRGVFDRFLGMFSSPNAEDDYGSAADYESHSMPARPALSLANLQRIKLEDVAVPRAEIVAVAADTKKEDLVQIFRESGMTRLPVYNGTLDTPIGLVHLKDFALTHGFNGASARFSLRKMVRPLLYAPPSMPIGVMLQKMQSERMHMALVIDEYGGVDGLVTIEDLIEQVIGEIEDEHDIDEGLFWTEEKPGQFIAQARAPLDEFESVIGLKLSDADEDEESDTLGGLIFVMIGRVPARGEVIPHPSGAEFTIVDADPRRIKRVRVRLPEAMNAAD